MSFRARLTAFFVLIVIVPMAAVAVFVFVLIDDSSDAKGGARAAGIADTASAVYLEASRRASADARTLARQLALVPAAALPSRADALAAREGIVRLQVRIGERAVVDVGDRTAVAPGLVVVRSPGRPARTVTVSNLSAAELTRELGGSRIAVVVRASARQLAARPAALGRLAPVTRPSTVRVGGRGYRAITQSFAGFGATRVEVTMLSDLAATTNSTGRDRTLAVAFIAGFLVLAGVFALLASRALQRQLGHFLRAARRLGSGDFTSPIRTSGRDEFAALADEFNSMSGQLEQRLDQLELERERVRAAIRRIGEAFASGLDRDALLELALSTAMDATAATRGRVSARAAIGEPLTEFVHEGRLADLEGLLFDAERAALAGDGVGAATHQNTHLAAAALGRMLPGGPSHGVITVVRDGEPFSADDLELLRSLSVRATLALANVNIHEDVRRQAITDDLTGLASHGHFQELLSAEMREVQRYDYPVGLLMIDIDNFKSVNDTHGHQQGDEVLREVARVLRESSREADLAARYGGEEMALVLPHTDLEGVSEIAERVRSAIEDLHIPLHAGPDTMRITASLGAAATADGDKDALIGMADEALYTAKRSGKNRVVSAGEAADRPLAEAVSGRVGE